MHILRRPPGGRLGDDHGPHQVGGLGGAASWRFEATASHHAPAVMHISARWPAPGLVMTMGRITWVAGGAGSGRRGGSRLACVTAGEPILRR